MPTADRAQIIAEARTWIGTRYRHQQSLKGVGADCLGFLRGLWRFAYATEPGPMPDYSSDWAEAGGRETLLEAAQHYMVPLPEGAEPRPGDVLLFRWKKHFPAKHCALLSAPGRIIHSYDGAGFVCEVTLAPEWSRRIAGAFAFPGLGDDA